MRACGVGLSCKNNRRLFPAENENCSISLTIASPRSRDTANRRTHDRLVHKNFVDSVTMGGDTPMVEDLAPETAPLVPFGGQASGDWAAEVDAEHELSGRNADVLQAEREKAKARAERFGETYTEPSAKTLAGAHGLLSRKEVLAVRREQAEKKAKRGDRFITGIDLFDPAEEAKRLARAHKFGAMLTDVTAEQQLVREKAETEKKERDAKNKKETANLSGDVADGDGEGMDAEDALKKNDILEQRVDPDFDSVWRNDAVHLYGVDHMTTADCVGYFGEYGPVFCEWINDSSCNVVFNDEHAARRAIRMKGAAMGAFAAPDGKDVLPDGLTAEMLWHSGPPFSTKGHVLQLSFRLATEDDIKPHGKIKSRYLWLGGKGNGGRGGRGNVGGNGKRRRGDTNERDGNGGRRDGRDGHADRRDDRRDDRDRGDDRDGGARGGKRRRGGGGGMRAFDDDDGGGAGIGDLREKLKKRREEIERARGDGGDAPMAGDASSPQKPASNVGAAVVYDDV